MNMSPRMGGHESRLGRRGQIKVKLFKNDRFRQIAVIIIKHLPSSR